ncbi:nicotinate phosphoribosyltransferase [Candidatus Pacearchaeota archaeon]|nr:nicotinate phosphoribosyltransferase [Candidatus Pacearchaeota archaeon]
MFNRSLLDTDFYKFTMAQAVLHNYPDTWVKYKFKCRNGTAIPVQQNAKKHCKLINDIIDGLCTLRATPDEINYLSRISFLKTDFVEYFRLLQLNRDYIRCYVKDNCLQVDIEGPWISTIWFEVPILAIISEVYHHQTTIAHSQRESALFTRLEEKIEYLRGLGSDIMGFKFADFGTRRRLSHATHRVILEMLHQEFGDDMFLGTSNVFFAKELNLKPIGTMAHEWLQAHQQLYKVVDSQKAAFDTWVREYRGELGIALSDIVGMDAFCRDFDLFFAKLFDGVRHDSGSPEAWGYKLISHYKSLGLDPMTKTAIFSDGLDFPTSIELYTRFRHFIQSAYCHGTDLTNDTIMPALQIVIKMVECNHQPVAKVSDSPGKGMCEDPEYLRYIKKVFKL